MKICLRRGNICISPESQKIIFRPRCIFFFKLVIFPNSVVRVFVINKLHHSVKEWKVQFTFLKVLLRTYFHSFFLSKEVLSVLESALGFMKSSVGLKDAEFIFTVDYTLLFVW